MPNTYARRKTTGQERTLRFISALATAQCSATIKMRIQRQSG